MKIQTFSVIVGSNACNAHCPFCVSRMTPNALEAKPTEVNWRNFDVAVRLACRAGVTTAMLTGKGEPTLWPDLIDKYLYEMNHRFPLVELQTNGKRIAEWFEKGDICDTGNLAHWYQKGLTTISISVAHWDTHKNAAIYSRNPQDDLDHFNIGDMVENLHKYGFSVRLSCVLLKGMIDRPILASAFITQAKQWGVDQITFVPVSAPRASADPVSAAWVKEHELSSDQIIRIKRWLDDQGDLLMELAHGALVYDINGQNVCLSNCLKNEAVTDKTLMRNLIFHPDGHLRYDWSHEGSIIL